MAEQPIKVIIGICDGFNLLLPSEMIADIVSGVNVSAVEEPYSWQRGNLNWSGMTIPVLSFEQLLRNKPARLRGSHIVVIRGTSDTETLPFYGLPIQAMPNEYRLESSDELVEEEPAAGLSQVAVAVRVRGVPCIIPEIAHIEEQIASDLKYVAS